MPELTVNCEYPGCEKNITAETGAVALGLLQLHQKNVHDSITAKQKPPKVDRLRLNRGVSAEEFATWTKRYELWKGSTSLTPDEVPCQLIACLDSDLESALIQYHSDIAEAGEAEILKRIKALAVLDVAATVRITEMLGLKQQHGESARSFAARLRGKAQTCAFEVTCAKPGCGTKTQYTDEIVRFVLLAGIASTDISREVLGTTGIDNMSLTDTLALVEAKERAARATAGDAAASVAASRMSAYKNSAGPKGPSQPNPHETISCTVCGTSTVRYGRNRRGFRTEFRYCSDCFKSRRKRKPPPATPSEPSTAAVHNVFDAIDNIGGISEAAQDSTSATAAADACDNYLYDTTRGWHKGDSKAQPAITLNAGLDHQAYHTLNKSAPLSHTANIECISDSGAMSCLAPPSILPLMGLTQKNLLPVKRRMKTAAEGEISITGAVFLKLSGRDDNGAIHCAHVMVYISPNAAAFYLSRGAMEQLRIIPPSFPQVGAAAAALDITTAPCTCPTRTAPPGRPDMLPFPATMENTAKMKGWLLENYKSSTFNRCPHQSLPTMTGPEMEIRVHATCVPSVTRRPVMVPIHWRKKVKEDLDRDVALGVIEKVPPGTPVTWLHNMVLSAKPDGSPRRTVDLQPLNKHSVRETHHTVPPAQQARAVPKHQIMTVTDAWNGYHAIPIKAEDRHKTTFITEYGRYMWNFTITHIAGRSNSAADSASRNPTAIPDTLAIVRLDDDCHDDMEADIIATAQSQACSDAVTWRDLQLAQRNDEELKLLHPLVADGFPPERDLLPEQIRQYWQYRDRLYTIDGVLMMDHRTVIPTALRTRILDTLHAAHQGTSGMQSRAQDSVFWPGITQDISHRRSACSTCASMAPSQPHMPPTTPITPEYPFQAIVGDYFTLMGVKYLVIIDRFSGWPHIVRAQYSTEAAGARGLKRCLRHVFATFGVPEEFGSDGGPEFVAEETEIFFKQWGVKHRLSTAYNPESNGRAEVGVKSMKRLLSGNITANGSLDCDKVVSSLLQYRNTPEPSTGMSPSSILFLSQHQGQNPSSTRHLPVWQPDGGPSLAAHMASKGGGPPSTICQTSRRLAPRHQGPRPTQCALQR